MAAFRQTRNDIEDDDVARGLELRPVQVYVRLSDAPYAYGEILDRGRIVDYAADGSPIGVDFLDASGCANLRAVPRAAQVAEALRAHDVSICA